MYIMSIIGSDLWI